jgi:hypothetical protein
MAECGRGCVIARPASGWFCSTQVNLTMPTEYRGGRPHLILRATQANKAAPKALR